MHGRLPSTTLLCFTRSALDKLVRVPLLALLSCMTLHIKSLMYASSPPVYNFVAVHGSTLQQTVIPHCDTAYRDIGLHSSETLLTSDQITSSLSPC